MKMMKFQARELKEALQQIRQKLGPDALIVSTREVAPVLGLGRPLLEVTATLPDGAVTEGEAGPDGDAGAVEEPSQIGAAYARMRDRIRQAARAPDRASSSFAPRRGDQAARLFNKVTIGGPADRSPRTDRDAPPRRAAPPSQGADASEAEAEAMLEARLLPLEREMRAIRSQLFQVAQISAAQAGPSLKQEVEELRQVMRTMGLGAPKAGEMTPDVARLINLGIERHRAEAIMARVREIGGDPETALRKAVMERVSTAGPVGVSARVAAFIGPTGVGKTTTIAKIAARAALMDGAKVALITIDTFRVGAIDQLQRYADLMELPLHVAGTSTALKAAVATNGAADLILIDTAGRGPRDVAQLAALRELIGSADGVETHLCLSATTRAKEQELALMSYRPLGPTRLCVTKLDEAVGLGEVLTLHEMSGLPLSYFGTGQRVPEDLELCTQEGFSARLLSGVKLPGHAETGRGQPS